MNLDTSSKQEMTKKTLSFGVCICYNNIYRQSVSCNFLVFCFGQSRAYLQWQDKVGSHFLYVFSWKKKSAPSEPQVHKVFVWLYILTKIKIIKNIPIIMCIGVANVVKWNHIVKLIKSLQVKNQRYVLIVIL